MQIICVCLLVVCMFRRLFAYETGDCQAHFVLTGAKEVRRRCECKQLRLRRETVSFLPTFSPLRSLWSSSVMPRVGFMRNCYFPNFTFVSFGVHCKSIICPADSSGFWRWQYYFRLLNEARGLSFKVIKPTSELLLFPENTKVSLLINCLQCSSV